MNISIHHSETIYNSLKKNNLYEILSESDWKYIPSILLAMLSSDYQGKTLGCLSSSFLQWYYTALCDYPV